MEEKQKKNLFVKISIGVLALFFLVMVFLGVYKDILYKDYNTIHSEIDPDMMGYEIPIAKNVELVNNRVSDRIAYVKYNVSSDVYENMIKELDESEAKAEEDKYYYSKNISNVIQEFGLDFEMSYEIISAEKVEIEEIDKKNGVSQKYNVKFEIGLSSDGEEKISKEFERIIAEIDDIWIFYDKAFSAHGSFLSRRYDSDKDEDER